jgi:hypothetical protein
MVEVDVLVSVVQMVEVVDGHDTGAGGVYGGGV